MASSATPKLTKTHRFRLRDFLCKYLYQYQSDGLRSIFYSGSKDQYHAFVSEISRLGLNDLQATFPELGASLSLLTSGKIRDEVMRVIGQIKLEFPKCSNDILHLPGFKARMQVVYETILERQEESRGRCKCTPKKRPCNRGM